MEYVSVRIPGTVSLRRKRRESGFSETQQALEQVRHSEPGIQPAVDPLFVRFCRANSAYTYARNPPILLLDSQLGSMEAGTRDTKEGNRATHLRCSYAPHGSCTRRLRVTRASCLCVYGMTIIEAFSSSTSCTFHNFVVKFFKSRILIFLEIFCSVDRALRYMVMTIRN